MKWDSDSAKLDRALVAISQYQRWLWEFPDVALVLQNLTAVIDGNKSLCASSPPSPEGPWNVDGLRETLRNRSAKR